MKALRWIAAFPVALLISIAAWFLLSSVLTGAHGSPDWIARVVGYSPIIIRASFPTAIFVISAVLTSPSKGRKVPFVFFGIALLISGGGLESLQYYQLGMVTFLVTSFVGVVLGGLAGLLISLRLQSRRI